MKTCCRCRKRKPSTEFGLYSTSADGLRRNCRECRKDEHRLRSSDPRVISRKRAYSILRKYALSYNDYMDLWKKQAGLCLLCHLPERGVSKDGSPRWLVVDHDHACCPGVQSCGHCVRGLLCRSCNMALGLMGDNTATVGRALMFLAKSSEL